MDDSVKPTDANESSSHQVGGAAHSAITLVLRGDKLLLRNAVASCFNAAAQHLLVASAPILCLYGSLLELGGELLGTLAAEENIQFLSVVTLPWINAYGVSTSNHSGQIEHRVVSADLSASCTTHVVAERGALFTLVANPMRREVITADSDGGFKVWALRATTRDSPVVYKGFQRIHAGNRKTMYRRLLLTRDNQTILACATTRVHAFDSTTCARIGTYNKDPSSAITAIAFDRYTQAAYIQRQDSPSRLLKFQAAVSRGRIQSLEHATEHVEVDDIVAFEAIERGWTQDPSVPAFGGIVLIDACGNLAIRSFDAQPAREEARRINLQLAPSAERYIAMHMDTSLESPRNFVLVVCSSGIYVVEVFLPIASTITTAETRRVITNVPGTKLTMLEDGDWRRIAILNPNPPSLLLLHREIADDFQAMLLHNPSTVAHESTGSVVDLCAIHDGLVIAWSGGDLTHYSFLNERTSLVGTTTGFATVVMAVTFAENDRLQLVFVGDEHGNVAVWAFSKDGEARQICCKALHSQRITSILEIDRGNARQHDDTLSIVSASADGEVKAWHLPLDLGSDWDLLIRFRTYSSSISACALMGPEYLFCGSESGGFECWRLPLLPSMPVSAGRRRGGVAVLKRALHSIDLHLTRVCQVVVEPGDAAQRISSAPAHMDEFAWVITYDLDNVILIWCCSTTFLFPHRKLKVHGSPTGVFLDTPSEGSFNLMGYVGRCLECLDILTDRDKNAVKRRLRNAREAVQAQPTLDRHHTTIISTAPSNGLDDLLVPVRLRIILPTVEQQVALSEIEAARPHSPKKTSPNRPTKRDQVHSSSSPKDPLSVTFVEADVKHPDPFCMPVSLSAQKSDIARLETSTAPVKANRQRHTLTRASQAQPSSTYAPATLPSQFRNAKPRLYRTSARAVTTTNQSRCAVITTAFLPCSQPNEELEVDPSSQAASVRAEEQLQDKVAIVTLTDADLKDQLRLDFQGSGKSHAPRSTATGNIESEAYARPKHIVLLPWSSLQGQHQSTEVMAASRSRCVIQLAQLDEISIPSVADFGSNDVKAMMKVRSFSRWFLGIQQGRQRVREAFLREELRCAAQDGFVQSSLKRAGCSCPPQDSIDDAESQLWVDFTVWYATGKPFPADVHGPSLDSNPLALMTERLHDRTAFLTRRLHALDDFEVEMQSTEREAKRQSSLYIFDTLPSHSNASTDCASSWTRQTDACRLKELALALLDPSIQMAALLDDVALPDVSIASQNDIDLFAIASEFLSWWSTPDNFHRSEFVKQERKDAARSETARRTVDEETAQDPSRQGESFHEKYFRSETARLGFLVNKLDRLRTKNRIETIATYGNMPAPMLFETPPSVFLIPFQFPSPPAFIVVREVPIEQASAVITVQAEPTSVRRDSPIPHTAATLENTDDFNREDAELAMMATEDALSREFNVAYESASEDDQEDASREVIAPSKRTDFTSSYFFGNLPKKFHINAGGWLAGSGLDNGDEEIEEEERLDRERQRQETLDRLEAERIAEAERLAERLRIEKEKEEKALQQRRLHQVELRKILIYQLELEAKRAEQNEQENMMHERELMAEEERVTRECELAKKRERLARDAEEKQAAMIQQAERDARKDEMRRVLAEMTQMDAEDRRSAVVQARQLEKEKREKKRIKYLTELYEPFEPFFATSSLPTEESLPVIRRKNKTTKKRTTYAMPLAETLALDEVDSEVYVARDSRKLRQLLGLPVSTSRSTRRTRIPSEREIFKGRQALQLMLPPTSDILEEERQEPVHGNGPHSSIANGTRSNQVDGRVPKRRSHLPDLVRSNEQPLTDLSTAEREDNALLEIPVHAKRNAKTKPTTTIASPQRQQTALPFFRGNFMIKGERKSRAHDYAPRHTG